MKAWIYEEAGLRSQLILMVKSRCPHGLRHHQSAAHCALSNGLVPILIGFVISAEPCLKSRVVL